MDVNAITQFVSNLGFPIACCVACFWYINKSAGEHKSEMDKMAEAINNNTVVMQQLIDKIGKE